MDLPAFGDPRGGQEGKGRGLEKLLEGAWGKVGVLGLNSLKNPLGFPGWGKKALGEMGF